MRRAVAILALGLALAACSSGPHLQLHPTGPTAVTPATSSSTAAVQPLRRGFLEIGTYGTELFRPSFTIDIPVSSQWGTLGETGRRVAIGGQDGFFSFQALTAGGSPLSVAELRRVVAQPGVHVSGPKGSSFAGLPADRLEVVNGPRKLKVTFGGQRLSIFPHEHTTLWLVPVGTAPVLVTLGSGPGSASFTRQAMAALRSVRFQAAQ
jgi:hypothetical protein